MWHKVKHHFTILPRAKNPLVLNFIWCVEYVHKCSNTWNKSFARKNIHSYKYVYASIIYIIHCPSYLTHVYRETLNHELTFTTDTFTCALEVHQFWKRNLNMFILYAILKHELVIYIYLYEEIVWQLITDDQ